MKKIRTTERPGWRSFAESVGFNFHTFDGEPYWDESAYYQFSMAQIEDDLEAPTEELHQMALSLVPDIINSEELLSKLDVPAQYWDWIRQSWHSQQPSLYGRMDLAYDGKGPAKLLELNYDTPTSLYETGFFQWVWLEDLMMRGQLPKHADQFNSLQDQLEQRFAMLGLHQPLYVSAVSESIEDQGTVQYLCDIALQAGLDARLLPLEHIGVADGQFVDANNQSIPAWFKLYPWEFMLREDFGPELLTSQTQYLEPAWKMLLSNKGILPLLWQKYPNHPNLLPAFFETAQSEPLSTGWVRKPLYSREGANIELIDSFGQRLKVEGPYDDSSYIRQAFHALPKFGDSYTLIGSWIVGDSAAGIGIREDDSLITKDTSRFLPHIILD